MIQNNNKFLPRELYKILESQRNIKHLKKKKKITVPLVRCFGTNNYKMTTLRTFMGSLGIITMYGSLQNNFYIQSEVLENALNILNINGAYWSIMIIKGLLFLFGLFNLTTAIFLFEYLITNKYLYAVLSVFNTLIIFISGVLGYQYINFIDKLNLGTLISLIQLPSTGRINTYIKFIFEKYFPDQPFTTGISDAIISQMGENKSFQAINDASRVYSEHRLVLLEQEKLRLLEELNNVQKNDKSAGFLPGAMNHVYTFIATHPLITFSIIMTGTTIILYYFGAFGTFITNINEKNKYVTEYMINTNRAIDDQNVILKQLIEKTSQMDYTLAQCCDKKATEQVLVELKNAIEYLNSQLLNLKVNITKMNGDLNTLHTAQRSTANNLVDFHNQFTTLNDVVIQHLQEHSSVVENLIPPGTPTQMFFLFVITSITNKVINTKKYPFLSIGPTLLDNSSYNSNSGGDEDDEFNHYRKQECGGSYTSQIEKLQEMFKQAARTKQNLLDIVIKLNENTPVNFIDKEPNVVTSLFTNWDSLIHNFNQGVTHLLKLSSNKTTPATPPLSNINQLHSNQIDMDPLFQTLLQGIDQISRRNVIFRENILPNIQKIDKNIDDATTSMEKVLTYPMQVYDTINNMPTWAAILGTATGAIMIYSISNYIYSNVIHISQQTPGSVHHAATPLLTPNSIPGHSNTPSTIAPATSWNNNFYFLGEGTALFGFLRWLCRNIKKRK